MTHITLRTFCFFLHGVLMTLTFVHFKKTGGTSLGYYLDKCRPKIVHNSKAGDDQNIRGRAKHDGFPQGDAFTLVRHPLKRAMSWIAFLHSGSELTRKIHNTAGGVHSPNLNAAWMRQRINTPTVAHISDQMEAKLRMRLFHNDIHRTHLVLTDRLSTATPLMLAELGFHAPSEAPRLHTSKHLAMHRIFDREDIRRYEARYPITTALYYILRRSKGNYLIDAHTKRARIREFMATRIKHR